MVSGCAACVHEHWHCGGGDQLTYEPGSLSCTDTESRRFAVDPTRVRCDSIFLDKNRRDIGKSQ
jgi:hypothetical protein